MRLIQLQIVYRKLSYLNKQKKKNESVLGNVFFLPLLKHRFDLSMCTFDPSTQAVLCSSQWFK